MVGWPALGHQAGQHVHNIVARQAAIDLDGQAFPRVLVDHRQHPELPSIMGAALDKVIGPHMVRPARAQADAGAVRKP